MFSKSWVIRSQSQNEIHGYAVKRHILARQTQYQYVELIETYDYGLMLLLDGIIQSSQVDEFIYHEAIVHPSLVTHPNPKKVLIIGGGEGATLREVLKHPTVETAVMVDIDRELVNISREYLHDWHQGAFDDPRTVLVSDDGHKYLELNTEKFDCIILDTTDPFEGGPAQPLYTLEFYRLIKHSLNGANGTVTLQAQNGFFRHATEHYNVVHTLKQVFNAVFPYYVNVPVYAPDYGFVICGSATLEWTDLISPKIDQVLEKRGIHSLRFYDSRTAQRLFSLPKYARAELALYRSSEDSKILR